VVATGAGRVAGGARIPELAPPPAFPLPNGLKRYKIRWFDRKRWFV